MYISNHRNQSDSEQLFFCQKAFVSNVHVDCTSEKFNLCQPNLKQTVCRIATTQDKLFAASHCYKVQFHDEIKDRYSTSVSPVWVEFNHSLLWKLLFDNETTIMEQLLYIIITMDLPDDCLWATWSHESWMQRWISQAYVFKQIIVWNDSNKKSCVPSKRFWKDT